MPDLPDQKGGNAGAQSRELRAGPRPFSAGDGEPASQRRRDSGSNRFDSYSATAMSDTFDRALRAIAANATFGISPSALAGLWFNWLTHLALTPGKRLLLMQKAWRKQARLLRYAAAQVIGANGMAPVIDPLPQDHRFDHPGWRQPPFDLIYQSFLLNQQWWFNATTGVRGMEPRDEFALSFMARQMLDVFAPSNIPFLNPEVMARTFKTGGGNFLEGWQNLLEDAERTMAGKGPAGREAFVPGQNVAVTPGKIVFRNRLIELIQYEAATPQVRTTPILIVPAWIMKYYILDLSPDNSLVRYLVSEGFTVFMISWTNPSPEDRDLDLDDYFRLGPLAALDAIEAITGAPKVHLAGYCLGGTLASITAAEMARLRDNRLASLSLFAAQQDFTEAGELMMFISESEISYLEDMMWEQGFLDARQMSGAFQILRSNDLVWSRYMREYLLGERAEMDDLKAWNADTTRMPYKMHSAYLRRLYKNNELATGRFTVDGAPIALKNITCPIFTVATEHDHVAPWHSVYKIHLLADVDITFVLAAGGHNRGILSQPGRPGIRYSLCTSRRGEAYVPPEQWQNEAPKIEGSWWSAWRDWLVARENMTGDPPPLGAASGAYAASADAPGSYVFLE